jgi:hypothetical protein
MPQQQGREITIADRQEGKLLRIEWFGEQDPTPQEIQEIFAQTPEDQVQSFGFKPREGTIDEDLNAAVKAAEQDTSFGAIAGGTLQGLADLPRAAFHMAREVAGEGATGLPPGLTTAIKMGARNVAPSLDQFGQAVKEVTQGAAEATARRNPVGGMTQILRGGQRGIATGLGLAPVIGEVGRAAEEGQFPRAIARAAAGFLGPAALARGLPQGAQKTTRLTPRGREPNVARLQFGDAPARELPLFRAEQPNAIGSGIAQLPTSVVARVGGVRAPLIRELNKRIKTISVDAADDAVQAIANINRVGPDGARLPQSTINQAAQEAFLAGRQNFRVAAGRLYDAADQMLADIGNPNVINVRPMKEIALKFKQEITNRQLKARRRPDAQASEILDELLASPNDVPFGEAQRYRSDLLDEIRRLDASPRSKRVAVALEKATEEALERGAQTVADLTGDPTLMATVRRANDIWKKTSDVMRDRFIKGFLNRAPDDAHVLLESMPIASIKDIELLAGGVKMRQLRAGHMRATLERFTIGDEVAGRPGSLLEGIQPRLRGKQYGDWLRKQDETGRLEALYPGMRESQFEMAEAAEKLGTIAQSKELAGFFSTNLQVGISIAPVMALFAEVFGFAPAGTFATTAATAGGSFVLLRGLAEIMSRPQGIKLLRSYTDALGEGRLERSVFFAARLQEMADQANKERDEGQQ